MGYEFLFLRNVTDIYTPLLSVFVRCSTNTVNILCSVLVPQYGRNVDSVSSQSDNYSISNP